MLLGVFFLNAALFVPLGEQIGQQFQRLPNLRAYAWDLGGSLAGTLVFGLFAVLHFSPQIGLAIAVLLFGLLYPAQVARACALVVLVCALPGALRRGDGLASDLVGVQLSRDGRH